MSKNKISINTSIINQLGRKALLESCHILGLETTRLIKGGITCQLSCHQLRTKIRQQLGRGTFPDRIERMNSFLQDWQPTELDSVSEEEAKPEDVVRELIEDVRNALDRLNDIQLLELLAGWLQNPQGGCCYEELDAIAEQLGFCYEEIDEELVLIAPSPLALSKIISTTSDATFYHTFIALAGMALSAEQFSPSPSMLNDGYDFMRELAKFLRKRARNTLKVENLK